MVLYGPCSDTESAQRLGDDGTIRLEGLDLAGLPLESLMKCTQVMHQHMETHSRTNAGDHMDTDETWVYSCQGIPNLEVKSNAAIDVEELELPLAPVYPLGLWVNENSLGCVWCLYHQTK